MTNTFIENTKLAIRTDKKASLPVFSQIRLKALNLILFTR